MKWFKKIQFKKISDNTTELIFKVCSFPIWFFVTCYKYGLVYSDNLINKFIEE